MHANPLSICKQIVRKAPAVVARSIFFEVRELASKPIEVQRYFVLGESEDVGYLFLGFTGHGSISGFYLLNEAERKAALVCKLLCRQSF